MHLIKVCGFSRTLFFADKTKDQNLQKTKNHEGVTLLKELSAPQHTLNEKVFRLGHDSSSIVSCWSLNRIVHHFAKSSHSYVVATACVDFPCFKVLTVLLFHH